MCLSVYLSHAIFSEATESWNLVAYVQSYIQSRTYTSYSVKIAKLNHNDIQN